MRLSIAFLLAILSGVLIYSCGTESTPTYTVTTSFSPAEAGSVELDPPGGTYDEGTEVTATADPNEGWTFSEWDGTVSSTQNPYTFTVDEDINLESLFIKKTYPLNIETDGEGSVAEQIVSNKNKDYEHGTIVELTPEPNEGWSFLEWTGDLSGSETPIQITVDEEKSVTARFEKIFFLAENGVTIKCPNASPGDKGTVDGIEYEAVDRQLLMQRRDESADLTKVCTSLVTNMNEMFAETEFNESIGNWDVSNVTQMFAMFRNSDFNQPVAHWDVSNVENMVGVFSGSEFNQPIENWDVSSATDMYAMFEESKFNQPLEQWDVSNVKNMASMFNDSPFNQPIGNWDVSNVEDMGLMFSNTTFNQSIGDWDVSSVTDMEYMFQYSQFNKPLQDWDVSNVTIMNNMFSGSVFNQPIGNWDVSSVTEMRYMFQDSKFNQPLQNWDVGNVTKMRNLFSNSIFNQPIGEWDVSSATSMLNMFRGSEFNQPIGEWDVSSVTNMGYMYYESEFNQDISGWCVSQIPDEPDGFATSSPLTEQNKPKWGTCPGS